MRSRSAVRRCRALPLLLVLTACGGAASNGAADGHGEPAAHGKEAGHATAEPPSQAGRALAATAVKEACAHWSAVDRATDLTQVAQLRVKAEVGALKAARNDPSWSDLADDLAELRVLEADYAAAGPSEAKALLASIEGVRARIPTRCPT